MNEYTLKRGHAIRLNARDGAIGDEVEAVFKPWKPWLVVSDKEADFTCCPMSSARNRTQRALLASNSSESKPESEVDCQQLWTIGEEAITGPAHAHVDQGTLAQVEEKLRDYLSIGDPKRDRSIYQGAIVWLRMPASWIPPNAQTPHESIQKEREANCWRDPDLADHWVLPSIIISSNRYLPQSRHCPPGIYHLMTVAVLRSLRRNQQDKFTITASVGLTKVRFRISSILMTYDWRVLIGGLHRVFRHYPGVKFDPCPPDTFDKFTRRVFSNLLLTPESP